VIAVVLTLLGFVLIAVSQDWAASLAWFQAAGSKWWVAWPMAAVGLVVFQQLTYLVPRVPVILRWAAAAAALYVVWRLGWPALLGAQIAAVSVIALTLVARLLLPSAPDHALAGYAGALAANPQWPSLHRNPSVCERLGLKTFSNPPEPRVS